MQFVFLLFPIGLSHILLEHFSIFPPQFIDFIFQSLDDIISLIDLSRQILHLSSILIFIGFQIPHFSLQLLKSSLALLTLILYLLETRGGFLGKFMQRIEGKAETLQKTVDYRTVEDVLLR